MTHIEEAIVDLLLRHNCVVVPAFGGFVAQTSSAQIDYTSGTMLAPRKSVLFNRQLLNNDGLLISHISQNQSLAYDGASELVKSKVSEWQKQLADGQRVTIDKIGYLYLDAERNIGFEQDRFFNLLLESYGLSKVYFIGEQEVEIIEEKIKIADQERKVIPVFTPVLEEEIVALPLEEKIEKEIRKEEAKIIALEPIEETTSKRKLWKYVAAAVLIPLSFYTYWLPMKTNVLESGMLSFSDFNPNYKSVEGKYESTVLPAKEKEAEVRSLDQQLKDLPADIEVYFYKYSPGMFIPVRVNEKRESVEEPAKDVLVEKATIPDKTEVTPVVEKIVVVESKSPEYIVGCFSDMENATDLVAKLKKAGFQEARLVKGKNGLTRVSAGKTISSQATAIIKAKATTLGLNGWILK
ncbi:MAG: cell division septation protein DedD [Psychromonas sp.]|jgi:cell division septation protein DedD